MTLDVRLVGKNGYTEVDEGANLSFRMPYPPRNVPNRVLPFITRMSINGLGVVTNLNVDGSVTPIDAFVAPTNEGDLYVKTANILIADGGAISLNSFGSIVGGLANGVGLFVELGNRRIDLELALKTNFDFIRIGTDTVGTGSKTDAYQLAKTDPANNDGYNPVLDFSRASPEGIRLIKGSKDKLGIRINDDLTSVATFDIIIKGYIRF